MLNNKLKKKAIATGVLLLVITLTSFGQYHTNTPYSRYGIGNLAQKGFAENIAMGGLSVGLRQQNLINYNNPASYTTQNPQSFIFDVGMKGNYTYSRQNNFSSPYELGGFNVHHLAIGFPITPWLKSSIGIVPYSKVGYSVKESISYDPVGEVTYNYEGKGGINKFYIGNAVELFKRLSLGFNFSYLFGSINQNSEIIFPEEADKFFDTYISTKDIIGDIQFNYGIQYSDSLSDNLAFTLGAVFDHETRLNYKNDHFSYYETASGSYDTLKNITGSAQDLLIPAHIGLGISGSYKDMLTIGLDYHQQDWSNTSFRNINENSLTMQNEWLLGVEYVPDRYSITSYFDRIRYRVGGYYKNTYLQINGDQIQDKAITLGLGLPFGNSNTSVNFAFELGRRGSTKNGLIEENYVNLLFNITLYDFWFFKRKFD